MSSGHHPLSMNLLTIRKESKFRSFPPKPYMTNIELLARTRFLSGTPQDDSSNTPLLIRYQKHLPSFVRSYFGLIHCLSSFSWLGSSSVLWSTTRLKPAVLATVTLVFLSHSRSCVIRHCKSHHGTIKAICWSKSPLFLHLPFSSIDIALRRVFTTFQTRTIQTQSFRITKLSQ